MLAHTSFPTGTSFYPKGLPEDEKTQIALRAHGIENFRVNVLPLIFPHIKTKWRFDSCSSTRGYRIEPRDLIDHPRTFVYGRKRKEFVVATMPYGNVPESGTAIGYEWGSFHWRAKTTFLFRELPSEMSWHFPGSTKLLLLWPEEGIQPDFRGIDL